MPVNVKNQMFVWKKDIIYCAHLLVKSARDSKQYISNTNRLTQRDTPTAFHTRSIHKYPNAYARVLNCWNKYEIVPRKQ